MGTVHCKHVTAKAFREFSEKTWRPIAWERGKPPKRVIDAKRGKVKCAAGPGHRRAIQRKWSSDHREFAEHRAYMLEDPWEREWRKLSAADQAWAMSTGECESGNVATTNTGNGFEGSFQFERATWHAAGGSGGADEASWYEQAVRAVRWRDIAGAGQWPNCGS
jgi:hypothetical protein